MNFPRITSSLLVAAALASGLAQAQTAAPVTVDGAWVRASVQGQKATGAFMRLTASEATRLVGAASPAAGVTEVHEMKMEGDVMKMSEVPGGIVIPPGATVELKPKSLHVMFMGLKAPVKEGETIAGTLTFEKAGTVDVDYDVMAPNAGMD